MTQAKNIKLKQLAGYVKSAKKVLVATHENPDGDGIGSIIAFGEGLRQLGKQVKLYIKDPVPKIYHYLPGQKKIKQSLNKNEKFDLSFIVDLGDVERVGNDFVKHPDKGTVISIDHHAMGAHNGDYNFCLPKQASSGEVIYKVLKSLKVKFNKTMAVNIYTAMVTDTGSFKYSNTSKETFEIAADLASFNIDYWEVALNCFETCSLSRMELLKRVISGMEISKNKKIAWIQIKKSDFKKTGATSEDTEGLINYPRSIEGVEVAIAFKEQSKGCYKISLRSKNYVDVGLIASDFNGGGHARASGFKLKGSFDTVKKNLFKKILPLL